MTYIERKIGIALAKKYALKLGDMSKDFRNAEAGQWKKYFTPKVEAYFNENYGDILDLHRYWV